MASGLKKEVTINILLGGACGNVRRLGEARRPPRWTLFDEIGWGEEEVVVKTAAAMSPREIIRVSIRRLTRILKEAQYLHLDAPSALKIENAMLVASCAFGAIF